MKYAKEFGYAGHMLPILINSKKYVLTLKLFTVGPKSITRLYLFLWLGGFRIQPTFALVRVVRGD